MISVVIPIRGRTDLTKQCLDSLYATSTVPFEVITLETPTNDPLVEVRDNHRNFVLPYNPIAGAPSIAEAWNRGAEIATGEHVLFLNNDTVFGHRALDRLVRALESRRYPVLSPRIIEDGSVEALAEAERLPESVSFESITFSGCAFAMEKSFWAKMNGFDTQFTFSCEDDDFRQRFEAQNHHSNRVRNSLVFHHRNATSNTIRNFYLQVERDRSFARFLRKYHSYPQACFGIDQPRDVAWIEFTRQYTDIQEHLPVLALLARDLGRVVELGVRSGVSTAAFLQGGATSLCSVDISNCSAVVQQRAQFNWNTKHEFVQSDSLTFPPRATDLLFIDTLHEGNQLLAELRRHAPTTTTCILLHDTETYGQNGEGGGRGLRSALDQFLQENPSWREARHWPENNGLTLLVTGDRHYFRHFE